MIGNLNFLQKAAKVTKEQAGKRESEQEPAEITENFLSASSVSSCKWSVKAAKTPNTN